MIENMNEQENMILSVHRVGPDGTINETVKIEIDPSDNIVSESTYTEVNNNINNYALNFEFQDDDDKIRFHFPEEEDPTLTVIKVEVDGELNQRSYATQINSTTNAAEGPYVFTETKIEQINYLNLPNTAVISCQNCEKKFTTKYHYQRHTCEFNAEKVVLKPEVIGKDINKAIRMKYECDICKKSFISNSNLERHKNCHKNSNENACEHCNKTFVTENRLKIHKENHCKKTGDTTKFYRSDVAVWRCEKCKQVFASESAGRTHVSLCVEIARQTEEGNSPDNDNEKENNSLLQNNNETNSDATIENNITTESETKSNISVLVKTITEMLFQCEFCNRTYASKLSVLEHQQNHSTDKNYECISCKQHFDNFTTATEHWLNKCSNDLNLFYLPRLLYCEVCDKSFKSHEILYNHKNKKKHFVPKICKVKENKTDTDVGLVKMIENLIHTMEGKNQEGNSGSLPAITGIKVEDNIEDTSEESGGKKKRGRKRKYPKPEINNRNLTLGETCQYQCERCVMCFNDIAAMDKHKETVHATTHKCDQCGQVLQSAKALMIHSRAHQSLKPYVCDQCGRSYSQTSHLWQHMRFHQGIKPFACPHEGCEARYTIRPDLKDHIRKVHTRERPFKCNVCEKSFLTGSVYYQHRLIHTNDRRYGCEICNKRFFRADALNNHRRIHTDERPYPCPVCGREFRQKGDRNKHVRTQHSI